MLSEHAHVWGRKICASRKWFSNTFLYFYGRMFDPPKIHKRKDIHLNILYVVIVVMYVVNVIRGMKAETRDVFCWLFILYLLSKYKNFYGKDALTLNVFHGTTTSFKFDYSCWVFKNCVFFAYFTLQTDTLKRFIYDSDFRQSLASHCGYDLYKYKE